VDEKKEKRKRKQRWIPAFAGMTDIPPSLEGRGLGEGDNFELPLTLHPLPFGASGILNVILRNPERDRRVTKDLKRWMVEFMSFLATVTLSDSRL